MEPIERLAVEAQALMSQHPPRPRTAHKQLVLRRACPPGAPHKGAITFARYRAAALPARIGRAMGLELEVHPGVFPYPDAVDGRCIWTLNFADPELFVAYAGPLLAQDELQCAEHPVLCALREMLVATGRGTPLTVDAGRPTPVLVSNVERRLIVDTEPAPEPGRELGLYGNRFASAGLDVVDGALAALDPPTISNILAMAAPYPSAGRYDAATIKGVLSTAVTGFTAAVLEARRQHGPGTEVWIHTGFWGCGAFGGNRTLMVALQLLAAHATPVDRLHFFAVSPPGVDQFEAGRALASELLPSGSARPTADIVEDLVSRRYEWGVSDGN